MDPTSSAALGLASSIIGIATPILDALFRAFRSLRDAPTEFGELKYQVQNNLNTLEITKERAERLRSLTGAQVQDWSPKLLECARTLENLLYRLNIFKSEQRKWKIKKRAEWVNGTLRMFGPRIQTHGDDLRMICLDYGNAVKVAILLQASSEAPKQINHTRVLVPVPVRNSYYAQLANKSPAQIMDKVREDFDLEQLIGLNGSSAPRARAIMPPPAVGRIQELPDAYEGDGGSSGAAFRFDRNLQQQHQSNSLAAKHRGALAELRSRLPSRWSIEIHIQPAANGNYLVRFRDQNSGELEELCPREAATAPIGYRQYIWICGDKLDRVTVPDC